MVFEMREKARAAGVLTPHIRPDGSHRSQRETAAFVALNLANLALNLQLGGKLRLPGLW